MKSSKISLKIYGQEYTIAGEKSGEHITRVAKFVDEKMRRISSGFSSGTVSDLAVLTAINIADDMFSADDENCEIRAKNEQLKKDVQHYVKLWDDAKKSFSRLAIDAKEMTDQRSALNRRYEETRNALEKIKLEFEELEQKAGALEKENEELAERVNSQENGEDSSEERIRELENKCREMESSFFDLQMENIRLSDELERYKKNADG
ncbi:MAG: cell division protein ZapA [Clostridiales Family XIII bacterium]|jgi:cell division protein ZapA|nr:cell division protein ZapA [Clostridiales Family XIII bacterium]